MVSSLLFPYYMDRSKPCLTCQHYNRATSVRDAIRMVEDSEDKIEYEYGQKLCLKHKVFVYFNWNCGEHREWKS